MKAKIGPEWPALEAKNYDEVDKLNARRDNGMRLFGKYFFRLWG